MMLTVLKHRGQKEFWDLSTLAVDILTLAVLLSFNILH